MFQFQQFTIHDDRCAMKVGTDGVLLGAWCQMPPTPSAARALDIGTGSGLIALMLAQHYPQLQIVGVELDADATTQARENVTASPFASQIVVKQGDIMTEDWREDHLPFDMIVSNPPYFEETLLSPNQQRAQARHVHHGLTFEALAQRRAQLLKSGGWLQVIIPKTAQPRFVRCAQDAGFSLIHQTDVHTVARKAPKRVMLRFQLHFTPPTQHENGHTIIGDFLQSYKKMACAVHNISNFAPISTSRKGNSMQGLPRTKRAKNHLPLQISTAHCKKQRENKAKSCLFARKEVIL